MTRIYHATASRFVRSNDKGTVVRVAFLTREGDLEVLIPTVELAKLLPILSESTKLAMQKAGDA
jgi:hypothetical protein